MTKQANYQLIISVGILGLCLIVAVGAYIHGKGLYSLAIFILSLFWGWKAFKVALVEWIKHRRRRNTTQN